MKIFNPNNILLEENAYIVLTHLCNRNCPFCIDIYRNKSKDYLSLEKLKEINPHIPLRDDNTRSYSQYRDALLNANYVEK